MPNQSLALFASLLFATAACGSQSAATDHSDAATAKGDTSIVLPKHSAGKDASHDAGSHDATSGGHETGSSDAADAADAGVSSDADAGHDVDNGAPSTVYPAPHPPLPTLTNAAGGPVLASPTVYFVFYPMYPYVSDLQKFATNMAQATFWNEVTAQYGVGPLKVGPTYTVMDQPPPSMITQTDLGAWVGAELASGAFGTPDPHGIYTVVFPESTTITQPNPVLASLAPVVSCVGFGGYHDNVSVALTDGGTPQNFSYAVIPTCDTYVDDLTAVISHEWVESATDPFLTSSGTFALMGGPDSAFFTVDENHAVWALLYGGEAGDLCEAEGQGAYFTPPDVGFTVQRTWSNLLAAGSHDPCAPDLPGLASFNSAPVLPETVMFDFTLTGNIVSQGITIPVGTSKTIEVDLYSDADTGGPWTVAASDVLYTFYGSYGLQNSLAFSWDRTQGVNGDKLHLTITVIQESLFGGAHAFMITSTLGGEAGAPSRQSIWPGLIVE